jgi:hypothetical protein
MSLFRISAKVLMVRLWRWLRKPIAGGVGQITSRSEFEKAVLIEKYGFNRYL